MRIPWCLKKCHTIHWLCEHGVHRVKWDETAYPGSYDPPEAPEAGFACEWCGDERLPYRAVWWTFKERWYEATGVYDRDYKRRVRRGEFG